MLQAESARRNTSVTNWARMTAARLTALQQQPIPDTTGPEETKVDAGASIFAADEISQAAPHPTIFFLGGLTAFRPSPRGFRFPTRLVALIRATSPTQVLEAESAWSRWVRRAGGSFAALSADDTPTTIAKVLGWSARGRSQAGVRAGAAH
jgi:hypothetical protein